MSNIFLVSVADVALFDPNNNNHLIGVAKANTDSSITSSIDSNEIRAGKGNKKVYEYKHSRTVDLAMTSAAFEYRFLALQTGNAISTGAENIWNFGECVTLDGSGVGTLAQSAVGGYVYTIDDNGTVYNNVPSGAETKTITFLAFANTTITVYYQKTAANVDKVQITSSGVPKIVTAILSADIADNTGIIGKLQIEIPRLQLSGEIEISMTPDGVSSTNLSGTALANQIGDCGEEVYAELKVFKSSTTVSYSALAASPSVITVDMPATETINVYGLRGSLYAPVLLNNTDLTFTSGTPGVATVSAAGVITGVIAGTCNITIALAGAESEVVAVTVIT
jgi:hypothetical protein